MAARRGRGGDQQRVLLQLLLMGSCLLIFNWHQCRQATLSWKATSTLTTRATTGTQNCTITDTRRCSRVLGREGWWVQDFEMAMRFGQYELPRVVPPGPFHQHTWHRFEPSAEAPVPWETSWRWVDANNCDCQIDYTVNADKFCALLETLRVDRILFLGDSLTQSQFSSFVNKMGPRHIDNFSGGSGPVFEASLLCSAVHNNNSEKNSTMPTNIPILMTREHGGGQPGTREPRMPLMFPNRTLDFIQGASQRVLAMVNLGAHYHDTSHFREDLDLLLHWLDQINKDDNLLVYFRTSASGHGGCSPRKPNDFNFTAGIRDRPLASYSDFVPTTLHDWHLFDEYNKHLRSVLEKRRKEIMTENRGRHYSSGEEDEQDYIRLLDVVNMTVLRSDGHSGGQDCLHYVEPGPVDWWNHLWYTLLQEEADAIGAARKQKSHPS